MTDAISEPASSPTCEPLPGCRICAPSAAGISIEAPSATPLGHSPGRREDAGLELTARLVVGLSLRARAAVVLVHDGLGDPPAELDRQRTHALGALRPSRLARRVLRRLGGRAAIASFVRPSPA